MNLWINFIEQIAALLFFGGILVALNAVAISDKVNGLFMLLFAVIVFVIVCGGGGFFTAQLWLWLKYLT